ncbi:hypothetical protein FBQ97_14725 [Acidobacteria bacterium ACD]|nr:MAG: hypothetical protein EDX89_22085 [Acidobacteriota bacterium]MCE7956720.1 hypothetical protein [Acidobacteria bacterium ACB2]MDL1951051.1 hypothetical protein [Acidobacteria bacterium ACD]
MRLVSLCPSMTESLVALGAGPDLVGVTRYCVHPAGALAAVRRVGGTKNPDLAAIRELAPDLVFANAEENRASDVEALSRCHRLHVSHPRSPAEVPGLLRRVGALVGRDAEAEAWARRVEEALSRAEALRGEPFRFVCLIWKGPWMAAGPRTYLSAVLALSGGTNALDGSGGPDYPVVTEAEVVALRPDRVFLPDEPYPFGEEDARYWRERVPGARVLSVPGDDVCWHGVRTLRGIEVAIGLATGAPARGC